MFSWFGGNRKGARTGHCHSGRLKRRHVRPQLESLEERVVCDAYRWSPPDTSTTPAQLDWVVAANWWDITTGTVAALPPSFNDDVQFRGTLGWNKDCYITSTAICRSITSNSADAFTKDLYIDGGSLTLLGTVTNDAYSDWENGNIDTPNLPNALPGAINVLENFTYNGTHLDWSGGKGITCYIGATNYTPYMYLGANCIASNAIFEVGGDLNLDTKYGVLQVQTTNGCNFLNNQIDVTPQGMLSFTPGATASSVGGINSRGIVSMGTNSTVSMSVDTFVNCTAGSLQTSGTGISYIQGDVALTSTVLQLAGNPTGYSQLYITGSLKFDSGSSYSYHVNGGSLTQSNQVWASEGINIAASEWVTSKCYTDGSSLLAGNHSYTPLLSTAGITGDFSSYIWNLGDINYTWIDSFTATQFKLTGNILAVLPPAPVPGPVPPPPPPAPAPMPGMTVVMQPTYPV